MDIWFKIHLNTFNYRRPWTLWQQEAEADRAGGREFFRPAVFKAVSLEQGLSAKAFGKRKMLRAKKPRKEK